jgi:predicted aspartyl protease
LNLDKNSISDDELPCATSIVAKVNEQAIEVLIDTGAATSMISKKFCKKLKAEIVKLSANKIWRTANGGVMKINAETRVSIRIGNTNQSVRLVVAEKISHRIII